MKPNVRANHRGTELDMRDGLSTVRVVPTFIGDASYDL